MITEKTKYYLTINGMRMLTKFREVSNRQVKPYSNLVQLQYHIANALAGHQRGLTLQELYLQTSFFPKSSVKDLVSKMRKAGYVAVASQAGVKPKSKRRR